MTIKMLHIHDNRKHYRQFLRQRITFQQQFCEIRTQKWSQLHGHWDSVAVYSIPL